MTPTLLPHHLSPRPEVLLMATLLPRASNAELGIREREEFPQDRGSVNSMSAPAWREISLADVRASFRCKHAGGDVTVIEVLPGFYGYACDECRKALARTLWCRHADPHAQLVHVAPGVLAHACEACRAALTRGKGK